MSLPFVRYRFLRLLFAISTVPEVFQNIVMTLLEGIEEVTVYLVDLIRLYFI